MNGLPIVLSVIDTEMGPVAETYLHYLEEIMDEHERTGLAVHQDYIAEDGPCWIAMRAYSCEIEEFYSRKDAIDWLTGGDDE